MYLKIRKKYVVCICEQDEEPKLFGYDSWFDALDFAKNYNGASYTISIFNNVKDKYSYYRIHK